VPKRPETRLAREGRSRFRGSGRRPSAASFRRLLYPATRAAVSSERVLTPGSGRWVARSWDEDGPGWVQRRGAGMETSPQVYPRGALKDGIRIAGRGCRLDRPLESGPGPDDSQAVGRPGDPAASQFPGD